MLNLALNLVGVGMSRVSVERDTGGLGVSSAIGMSPPARGSGRAKREEAAGLNPREPVGLRTRQLAGADVR